MTLTTAALEQLTWPLSAALYLPTAKPGNRVRRGPTLATSPLATGSAINRSPSQSASMPRPDGMPFNGFEIRTGPNRRGTSRDPKLSEAQSTSGVLDPYWSRLGPT
jgi:hypothetical protein